MLEDLKLEEADFALDEMPGEEMHRILRNFRERGPVEKTRFMGLPAFVITRHRALLNAFMDNESFPPHRLYQASFEGAIGETSHGSLGNLLSTVLRSPGQWSALAEEPSHSHATVRESLRWETPIAVLPRISASFDIEFEGVEIPANSWTLFAIAAANRDPEIFPDPDRFDPGRYRTGQEADESLTFGRGTKACPGMHLARKNMEVAFRVLLERLPGLELIDSEAALPRRTVLRCPSALRVRI